MRRALYPGSFDPITLGHIDLIERMSRYYDELIVLIANSATKSYLFSSEERALMVKESLQTLKSVKVDIFDGLTVEYANKVGADTIIRGLRAVSDFEYEFAMANMNRKLNPLVETVIVFTSPQYSYISSRMVKEVAYYGGSLQELVSKDVAEALSAKFENQKKD